MSNWITIKNDNGKLRHINGDLVLTIKTGPIGKAELLMVGDHIFHTDGSVEAAFEMLKSNE